MHIPGDDPMQGKDSDMTGIKISAQCSITEKSFSLDLQAELFNFRSAEIADIQEIRMPPDLTISSLQNMKKRIIIRLQC